MGMTYVKADMLLAVAQTTESIVVDLGLGIDEAARILGVEISLNMNSKLIVDVIPVGRAGYSFDPEDTVFAFADDEHFVAVSCSCPTILASTGAHKGSECVFFDFSGMNLITSRDLAFVLNAAEAEWQVLGKVYYEKYKPSVSDLNQLIAQRR